MTQNLDGQTTVTTEPLTGRYHYLDIVKGEMPFKTHYPIHTWN